MKERLTNKTVLNINIDSIYCCNFFSVDWSKIRMWKSIKQKILDHYVSKTNSSLKTKIEWLMLVGLCLYDGPTQLIFPTDWVMKSEKVKMCILDLEWMEINLCCNCSNNFVILYLKVNCEWLIVILSNIVFPLLALLIGFNKLEININYLKFVLQSDLSTVSEYPLTKTKKQYFTPVESITFTERLLFLSSEMWNA